MEFTEREENKMENFNQITEYERQPLTAVEVKAQVQLIQEVMKAVMVKEVHYGVIPGTNKPTLYKPGSEKILSTFRIAAYPKEIEDLSGPDEIRYRVKVHGLSMGNGDLIGVGVGECSSNEAKYKWRKPVCDEEFNETPEDRKRETWKKYNNKTYQQKQVRMEPADVANTILKMAKKRAQIDLTLTATCASDVFDQDLEDMPEEVRGGIVKEAPKPFKKPSKTPAKTSKEKTVETLVFDIEQKDGETDGRAWTRYGIIGEDKKTVYGTFSEAFVDLAVSAMKGGLTVKIVYEEGAKYNTVVNLEVLDPPEPPK